MKTKQVVVRRVEMRGLKTQTFTTLKEFKAWKERNQFHLDLMKKAKNLEPKVEIIKVEIEIGG